MRMGRTERPALVPKAYQIGLDRLAPPADPQHEGQHFGDGFIELDRDFVVEFDLRQRAGQNLVFLDRHAMLARHLDDLVADRAAALGDDARRALAVVMQRDGEILAPARSCGAIQKVTGGGRLRGRAQHRRR